jgi:hypothetical protein
VITSRSKHLKEHEHIELSKICHEKKKNYLSIDTLEELAGMNTVNLQTLEPQVINLLLVILYCEEGRVEDSSQEWVEEPLLC